MADSEYATVVGFVQFDVDEREVNGQTIRDITVKTPGTEGKLVRVTVWPEYAGVDIERGDFVAADGTVTVREHNGKEYTNLNAKSLAVIPGAAKAERGVVQKPAKKIARSF